MRFLRNICKEINNIRKDYVWFVVESSKFKSVTRFRSTISFVEFFRFEKLQHAYRKLTPEQQEAWYLSGEGRVMEF